MHIAIRSSKDDVSSIISYYINCMIICLSNKVSLLRSSIPVEKISTYASNNNFIIIMAPGKRSNWDSCCNFRERRRKNILLIRCKYVDISSKVSNSKFRWIFIKAYSTISNIEAVLRIRFLICCIVILESILIKENKVVDTAYCSFYAIVCCQTFAFCLYGLYF